MPVRGGEYASGGHIGRAVMDADIFISLSHFKGHESTGFGGAIKNIGIRGSRRKDGHALHGKPDVDKSVCRGCGVCMKNCAHGAIADENRKAGIDHGKCVGCGRCIGACNLTPYTTATIPPTTS